VRFSRGSALTGLRAYPLFWVFVCTVVFGMGGVFLLCGVVSQPVLSATLPAVLTQVPESGVWQTLFLAEDGRLEWNRKETSPVALMGEIRRVDPDRRDVLFVVEPGVAFREVARVWRLCREAGVRQVHIATLSEAP